jgi:tetratricopeptide (TPR) repeat protein
MRDDWTDRLSEYLDHELSDRDRMALDAHLATCQECRTTLEELRAVVARAASLQPVPPAADLWPGVEQRLDVRSRSTVTPFRARLARRVSFTLPQLVAAGLALMVLSGGAVWLSQYGGRTTSFPPVAATNTAPPPEGSVAPSVSPVALSDPRYDEAIRDLEDALAAGRSQLDPETVKILEANLQAIDQAIDQSRRALEADPANMYLNNHLAEARQRKLALLRRANAVASTKS